MGVLHVLEQANCHGFKSQQRGNIGGGEPVAHGIDGIHTGKGGFRAGVLGKGEQVSPETFIDEFNALGQRAVPAAGG